jgi:para-aminobenzoate synthetase component 1
VKTPIAYLNENDGTGIFAFGEGPRFVLNSNEELEEMQSFINAHKGRYLFTTLSYDLKSTIQGLSSKNKDNQEFPLATIWAPESVVSIQHDSIKEFLFGSSSAQKIKFVNSFFLTKLNPSPLNANFQARLSKKDYLQHIEQLKHEIQMGTIYEVNFCQEFYAENVQIEHPAEVYFKLNEITQAPFSCYISMPDFEVFCGSPERFIKKQSNKLISQPIKGTSKRGKSKQEDVGLKSILLNDPKERAENVMIVDLVRNDLSRIAKKNSVSVDELFGIYTFETVHQMISTISCEIEDSITFTDILKATFPMGSMTGAPKHSAMQLIEKHEDFQRGLYSGSIGYIAPNGDFDFNVVIRSLIYNTKNKYLSCPVGGAITIQSKPEAEYDECNTKVQSILQGMNA